MQARWESLTGRPSLGVLEVLVRVGLGATSRTARSSRLLAAIRTAVHLRLFIAFLRRGRRCRVTRATCNTAPTPALRLALQLLDLLRCSPLVEALRLLLGLFTALAGLLGEDLDEPRLLRGHRVGAGGPLGGGLDGLWQGWIALGHRWAPLATVGHRWAPLPGTREDDSP